MGCVLCMAVTADWSYTQRDHRALDIDKAYSDIKAFP